MGAENGGSGGSGGMMIVVVLGLACCCLVCGGIALYVFTNKDVYNSIFGGGDTTPTPTSAPLTDVATTTTDVRLCKDATNPAKWHHSEHWCYADKENPRPRGVYCSNPGFTFFKAFKGNHPRCCKDPQTPEGDKNKKDLCIYPGGSYGGFLQPNSEIKAGKNIRDQAVAIAGLNLQPKPCPCDKSAMFGNSSLTHFLGTGNAAICFSRINGKKVECLADSSRKI